MLVTQNIDDYHPQLVKESKILSTTPDPDCAKFGDELPCQITPHCYEIHGNSFYMHCQNEEEECSRTLLPCPNVKNVKNTKDHVPKCEKCGQNMKPHSMFFDESYNEHYYRKKTVDAFYEDCDALVVVGTALATTYANNIVVKTLEREVPVIEVNMEPCVLVGHTYQVTVKAVNELGESPASNELTIFAGTVPSKI